MYIRTENHIYLIHKDISYGGNKIYKIYNHDFSIIGNDFKVADTIEELCDEFVIDWLPTNHKDIFGIDKYSKKIIESCIGNNKTNVYGAIWTDKGLIYVAKMNEDGKLELI